MLAVTLADEFNIILHAAPGIGKTTAMVMAMISYCTKEIESTQVLCFTPTFESVMEVRSLTARLFKYTDITCNTVTNAKKWNGIRSHILIGTPIELAKLVAEENLLEHVKLICFDDADFSMTFESVANNVLSCSSAKTLAVTSSMHKDLKNLSNQTAEVLVFKTNKMNLLHTNVMHIMVNNEKDDRQEILDKILSTLRPQDRAVVFCNVSNLSKILKFKF